MGTRFKYAIVAVLVAAFIGVALFISGERKPKAPESVAEGPAAAISLDKEVPDIVFRTPEGGSLRLSEERGSVVVLNFWATWCPSCVAEMPSLQGLYNKKKDSGLKVITVLFKDTPEAAETFMKKNKYTLPVVIDPEGRAAKAFGLTGVPETFIIDKLGILREKIIGPAEFDTPDALAFFDRLLKR